MEKRRPKKRKKREVISREKIESSQRKLENMMMRDPDSKKHLEELEEFDKQFIEKMKGEEHRVRD